MKKTITLSLLLFVLTVFTSRISAQSIPGDSLYLGQTPPGLTPRVFKLEVTPGTFAAERVAISNDGTEIFYSEIKSYYPITGAKVRYCKYQDNKWNGSNILFDGFMGPALSLTGDTVFVEKDSKMYYSVREKSGWSKPVPFLNNIKLAHYLQITAKGNYYVSAKSESSVGGADWSKIQIAGRDTVAKSLGFPLNRVVDDLDFYIAKDESFMFTCLTGPICINYPNKDGRWSNGRYLSEKINFGISGWGVYMSPDKKYLFYTTGTKPDYSDVFIYWVGIGDIIDSMKSTNLPPYLKNLPKPQTAKVGHAITFTIPDDAVCDDDGASIHYEVLSLDGSELPKWLKFDSNTNTLSGIPQSIGRVALRFNAIDDKGSMTAFGFVINVVDK